MTRTSVPHALYNNDADPEHAYEETYSSVYALARILYSPVYTSDFVQFIGR